MHNYNWKRTARSVSHGSVFPPAWRLSIGSPAEQAYAKVIRSPITHLWMHIKSHKGKIFKNISSSSQVLKKKLSWALFVLFSWSFQSDLLKSRPSTVAFTCRFGWLCACLCVCICVFVCSDWIWHKKTESKCLSWSREMQYKFVTMQGQLSKVHLQKKMWSFWAFFLTVDEGFTLAGSNGTGRSSLSELLGSRYPARQLDEPSPLNGCAVHNLCANSLWQKHTHNHKQTYTHILTRDCS